jgi:hypothetical protein
LLVAIALLAGCGKPPASAPRRPGTERLPTPLQLISLQSHADAACRCQRRRGAGVDEPACWSEFDREIGRFEHSAVDTYCGDASPSWVCFGDDTGAAPGPNCIFRRRAYGACSAEEQASARREEDACG